MSLDSWIQQTQYRVLLSNCYHLYLYYFQWPLLRLPMLEATTIMKGVWLREITLQLEYVQAFWSCSTSLRWLFLLSLNGNKGRIGDLENSSCSFLFRKELDSSHPGQLIKTYIHRCWLGVQWNIFLEFLVWMNSTWQTWQGINVEQDSVTPVSGHPMMTVILHKDGVCQQGGETEKDH